MILSQKFWCVYNKRLGECGAFYIAGLETFSTKNLVDGLGREKSSMGAVKVPII